MDLLDFFLDPFVEGFTGFDEEEGFAGLFDLSFPPVVGFDSRKDADTGCKAGG